MADSASEGFEINGITSHPSLALQASIRLLRVRTLGIQDPASAIQHPPSAIRHLASSIQQPMPTATVEDYLKRIYLLQQSDQTSLVLMGRLATAMSVAPGTATAMIKTLAESELVDYEPRGGVRLTPSGERLALRVLRRHRLVELLLVEVLGLDWSQVHEEAEQLEHAISDTVVEKIDEVLGRPRVDPHGDPIPSAKGRVSHVKLLNLAECEAGQHGRIARIVDQDARFLKFASRHGLTPGAAVTVDERDDLAEAITVHAEGCKLVTMGASAALKIFLEG